MAPPPPASRLPVPQGAAQAGTALAALVSALDAGSLTVGPGQDNLHTVLAGARGVLKSLESSAGALASTQAEVMPTQVGDTEMEDAELDDLLGSLSAAKRARAADRLTQLGVQEQAQREQEQQQQQQQQQQPKPQSQQPSSKLEDQGQHSTHRSNPY